MKTEFDVNITAKDLFIFLFNNSYRKFTGILLMIFSIGCIGVVVYTWGDIKLANSILLLALALFYLVINPVILYNKAKNQVKNNEYFNKTLSYIIDTKGITVCQGDDKATSNWDEMWKAVKFGSVVVVYVTTIRAFILPIRCIGDKYNDFVDLARGGLNTRCRLGKKK